MTDPVVIIGSGLAGYTLAREFRKLDDRTPLQILTADDGSSYAKPMLSNALAKKADAGSLVSATAGQMAEQLNAEIITHTAVNALDLAGHAVLAADRRWRYSQLVLALGSDPVHLDLPGDGADAVQSVNDLADYARFRAALEDCESITILGDGLIGCEFANDLCHFDLAVHVVGRSATPLARLLPVPLGEALAAALTELGVHWHPGTEATGIWRDGRQLRIGLNNGDVIHSDVVLSAVGLRPRTALARAAGLPVNRGIVVDDCLQTGAADVFALGDCAEHAGEVRPFVMPIMHGARALARTLGGEATPVVYPLMPVVVKTPAYPLVTLPPPPGDGSWQTGAVDGGLQALYCDGSGILRGFALGGAATAERARWLQAMGIRP